MIEIEMELQMQMQMIYNNKTQSNFFQNRKLQQYFQFRLHFYVFECIKINIWIIDCSLRFFLLYSYFIFSV